VAFGIEPDGRLASSTWIRDDESSWNQRGTMRLLMEPMGGSSVHISIRFMGDPAGGLRWRSAFVDVPGGFRTVVQEGFHRLEQYQEPGRMAA